MAAAPPARGGDDRLLGSLAVREGLVSAQQVEECVTLQKSAPAPRKLGEILIEKGYITASRLAALLDIQSRQVRIVAADPARGGLFGQIALDLGFVPADKIEQALQEQAVLSRSGSPAMLGQILLRKGWLQTGQFLEILKVQRRTILRCAGCDTFYRFEEPDRGAKFACRRCGTIVLIPSAEPEEPRPGTNPAIGAKRTEPASQFGRYAIQEELGRGGMGIVYKALHRDLNTVFALKILRETEVSSAEVLDRFKREAQAEARLRHPNIVTIHDAGQEAGVHYLAMDYIEGDPLTTHLARGFKVRDMIARLEKVVRAVHHAHEQGIVHRDLKPANIMIDLAGEPHIMDFGLAKFLDDPKRIMLTKDGSFLGTPYYMAPEQIRGEARLVGPRSDIYSLGVILYEILCGRTPHVAPNSVEIFHKILSEEPPPPRVFNTRIHADLQTICLKAIDKNPAIRYASAGEFADDLRRYLDGEPIMARLQPWPVRAVRRLVKNKVTALAAISLLLFAISGGLVLFLVSRDAREFERLRDEARRNVDDRNYPQALLHSQAAQRLRPDDAGNNKFIEFVLDRIRTQQEEFNRRLSQGEKRREAEPKIAAAWTMLGMLPRQPNLDAAGIMKRAGEIEFLFDEAVKIVPDHEEALHGRACARILRGDGAGALEDLGAVLAKAPGRVEARYDAARLRLSRVIEARLTDPRPAGAPPSPAGGERRNRAHAEFSEVWSSVARDPARDEFAQAALRWLDGKVAESATGLDKFMERFPSDADAWRLRAMARVAGGDPAGAESDLGMAIRLAPADIVHRVARAWVRHGRADAAGADEDLSAAAELAPKGPGPVLLRGKILLERGDFAAAADAFAAAAALEPGAAAALGAGLARLRAGDPEAALEPLKRAADLDAGDVWPLLLRSEALDRLDRAPEALADVELALRQAPEAAVVHERRARVFLRLDRPADAVKDLEKAVGLDPSSGPRLEAELRAARERAAAKP
jgi:serine/threonine protein kinase/tetratricopeptide (TPR) repeat protein